MRLRSVRNQPSYRYLEAPVTPAFIGQLTNCVAAGVAAVIWFQALPGNKAHKFLWWTNLILVAVCTWYAVAYLILILDVFHDARVLIPYFRFAFPFVVIVPALRSMVYKRAVMGLRRG